MRGCLPEAIRMRPKAALAGFPYLELLQRTEIEMGGRVCCLSGHVTVC
jgi:hypothetical protein